MAVVAVSIPDTLVKAIERKRAILFAGAGISCTLGLPLFDVLTKHLAEKLNSPEVGVTDFPILAEYYLVQPSNKRRLFEWMRSTWHPPHIDVTKSATHNAIVDLNFPVIYTTNYDSWIERAFEKRCKPYRKIVRVNDLAETLPGETEIIKFHGDFEDTDTIVLTESHFLQRMSLDEPLDIRLRSDSLARPILFAGYSLSDPNIRYLLYRLRQLWSRHSEGRYRPTSYIVMVKHDPIQERLLRERGVEPIVLEAEAGEDPATAVTEFFTTLAEHCQPKEP